MEASRASVLLVFSALIFVGDWSVSLDVSWSVLRWADEDFLDPTLRCTVENFCFPLCSTPIVTTYSCPSLGIRLTTPHHRHPTTSCLLLLVILRDHRAFVHLIPNPVSVRARSTNKRYVCMIEYPAISLTSLPPSNLLSFSSLLSSYSIPCASFLRVALISVSLFHRA
jgi:hypothetical protein